jgi:endonuclease-3 related protein
VRARTRQLYELLRRALGPRRRWWPGATPLAVAVSAVLVQGVRWESAHRCLLELEAMGLERLHRLPTEVLAARLGRARFPAVKARRLQALARFVDEELGGDLGRLADEPDARTRLLGVPGVGPETADAILCYALGRPAFVADAYALRVFRRFGIAVADRAALAALVAAALPEDAFAEFHALVVDFARTVCRARPLCAACPLAEACPRVGVDPTATGEGGRRQAGGRQGARTGSAFPHRALAVD